MHGAELGNGPAPREERLSAFGLDETAARDGRERRLDGPFRRGKERQRLVDGRAERRPSADVAPAYPAHRPIEEIVTRKRRRCRKAGQTFRRENERMAMRMGLDVDERVSLALLDLLPRDRQSVE